MTIEYLLRRHLATGDPRPLAVARRSLDAMADGGLRDQLGGGFHRYSTDARWLVPHFEQMLYDNAQLARVYVHAWALTGDARYRAVATGTLDYMLRELDHRRRRVRRQPGRRHRRHRGPDVHLARRRDPRGPGRRAPAVRGGLRGHRRGQLGGGHDPVARRRRRRAGRARSASPRPRSRRGWPRPRAGSWSGAATRPQPARDGKALAAWNGLAIAAFADAAVALAARDPDARGGYRAAAQARGDHDRRRAARRRTARSAGRGRTAGRSGQGVLEDYAHLADGLLALYEATFDERWFTTARGADGPGPGALRRSGRRLLRHGRRPRTARHAAQGCPGQRRAVGQRDGGTVLLRLAAWTGEGRYRDAAERAMRTVVAVRRALPDRASPSGSRRWTCRSRRSSRSRSWATRPTRPPGAARPRSGRGYRPNQVVAVARTRAASAVPLLADRVAIDGRPTAYVCRGFACRLPVTDPAALRRRARRRDADG